MLARCPLALLHRKGFSKKTFTLQSNRANYRANGGHELGNLEATLRARPGSKSVANWQTHFFAERKSPCASGLREKLSLPTVANSPGKLANSLAALVEQFTKQIGGISS